MSNKPNKPNKLNKFEINVSGKYYVKKTCIGCTLCTEIAPDNFKINTDENLEYIHVYVYKQPINDKEEALCLEAIENCPADAIGCKL